MWKGRGEQVSHGEEYRACYHEEGEKGRREMCEYVS